MNFNIKTNDETEISQEQFNWPLLGFLRGILAFTVVIVHYRVIHQVEPSNHFIGLWDGLLAVWFFFIISGFSISHSYYRHSTKQFYWRRFKRIYPSYIIGIILGVLIDSTANSKIILGHLFFLQTILIFPWNANIALWSLPTEVVIYIFAPLIFLYMNTMNLGRIICILVLINMGLAFYQINLPAHIWGNDILKLSALWLIGAWLYRIFQKKLPTHFWLDLLIGVIFLMLVFDHLTMTSYFLMAVGYLIFINLKKELFIPSFILKTFTLIGDISYPLYACHYPILFYAHQKRFSFALSIIACIIIATITHFGTENILRWLTARKKLIRNLANA